MGFVGWCRVGTCGDCKLLGGGGGGEFFKIYVSGVMKDGAQRKAERMCGEKVVISDYPAPELLANVAKNVETNVPEAVRLRSRPTVQGHEWGEFATSFATTQKGYFSRILAADCLWMPQQHRNLARSMVHFLSTAKEAQDGGRVFVVAGFHTGRAKVAGFLETAEEEGLVVERIEEMDVEGRRREWRQVREGEDLGERKRWVVVAVLRGGRVGR